MRCPNCNGQMGRSDLRCAYCGWENPAVAEAAHRADIHSIYAKTARLLSLPEKLIRKLTKILLRFLAVAIALSLVVMLCSRMVAGVRQKQEYARQQEVLAVLEEAYAAGDYERVYDTMQDYEYSYRASFDKYAAAADLWRSTTFELEWLEETVSYGGEIFTAQDAAAHIAQLQKILGRIDEMEQAGFAYGEEEAALHFRAVVEAALENTMKLTPEEITASRAWEPEDESLTALAERCHGRMFGEDGQ